MLPGEPTVHELFDLTGNTALVTGASGHLGGAMSRALCEAGCQVVVASRELERAREIAIELPANHLNHVGIAIDHLDADSIAKGFDEAIRLAGKVDILVNNGHEPLGADWSSVQFEQFTRQLANSAGYFELARHLRNHVVARRAPGRVIMLGSMYGQVASYPDVYEGMNAVSPVAYHALKGGVIQMTRHLAAYWAHDRVLVNCISPGAFPNSKLDSEFIDRLRNKIPLQRIGMPHELKGAVVFLASEASAYMTGHNLVVDGGWTAW